MSGALNGLLRLGASLSSALYGRSRGHRGVGPLVRGLRRLSRVAFVPQVVERRGRRWLITDLRNNAQEALFFGFPYDPSVSEMLRAVLRPGDTAVDVGANVGIFTAEMAELVGRTGRVIAFEPSIDHARVLCANLALQGLDQVEVRVQGLGARSERVLHYTTASSGSVVSSFPEVELPVKKEQTIELRRLDAVLDQTTAGSIRCIKIDVDGNEHEILRGALELLDRARPFVILEVSERTQRAAGATAASLLATVEALGYRFSRSAEPPYLRGEELLALVQSDDQLDVLCSPIGGT